MQRCALTFVAYHLRRLFAIEPKRRTSSRSSPVNMDAQLKRREANGPLSVRNVLDRIAAFCDGSVSLNEALALPHVGRVELEACAAV